MNSRTASYCVSRSSAGTRSRSGKPSGGTANSRSPERRSATRLVTSIFNSGSASQQFGDLRRSLHHLLEVVEQQQQLLVAQIRPSDSG